MRQMMSSVLNWLDGAPDELTFYLLEPGTIEQEGRVKALEKGIILDLFPHCLALLIFFGNPDTFRLEDLKVGRYETAQIDRETFAAIKFTFQSHDGKLVKGTAYIGKAVGGVRDFLRAGQLSASGPPRMLEVRGSNGRIIRLDFLRGKNTFSIEQGSEEQVVSGLIDPPHNLLVDSLLLDRMAWDNSCFSVSAGKTIVRKLEEIRGRVPSELGTYQNSDFLEAILGKI